MITRRPNTLFRVAALLMTLALLATVLVVQPSPVMAQEQVAKPWSLRNLFFPRKRPRLDPQQGQDQLKPKTRKATPRKTARKPAEPPIQVVEKLPDAKVVLVVGDFVAAGAAEGLNAAFATNPRVRIVDRTNGSSGFARPDHFDWPGGIAAIVATEKPAVVVFVIGANDRQQMRVGSAREPVRSEAWTTEYTQRATAFATAMSETRTPFVWLGAPPFKTAKTNSNILAFNEVFRGIATDLKAEFIDVWDGFVDENGAFVTTGPDVNGQPVRLRAGDGINFTGAGKRKLAFYTEKPLKKILGESAAVDIASLPSAALPGASGEQAAPGKIERTVPVSVNDPVLDGGSELMGAQIAPKTNPRLPGGTLEGTASAPTPGRADDFSWPPNAPTPSTALLPAAETTTAIGR